ncbi:MAG: hypothetical protein ABIR94_17820, partial [Rubrivivax sp.]
MELLIKSFGALTRDPRKLVRSLLLSVGVPVLAMLLFLALWATVAPRIDTSLGAVPGPKQVAEQAQTLWADHFNERRKQAEFYARQDLRNQQKLAEDPSFTPRQFEWTGKPTYFDQIVTSLITVFTGFALATMLAVPLGILAGSSKIV